MHNPQFDLPNSDYKDIKNIADFRCNGADNLQYLDFFVI